MQLSSRCGDPDGVVAAAAVWTGVWILLCSCLRLAAILDWCVAAGWAGVLMASCSSLCVALMLWQLSLTQDCAGHVELQLA
jgi:hypothetical protein